MPTVSEAGAIQRSQTLFATAQQYIPGGVNSPVRAFLAVNNIPRFIKSAKGAYITDVDDNEYIDYVGSWGPMILGHAYPTVIQAVQNAAKNGLSYGPPAQLKSKWPKKSAVGCPTSKKFVW